MEKGRKLNKLKVGIVVIIVILTFSISVFGRYIYNTAREAYLTARKFYFSSNILTVNKAHYQYEGWSGVEAYEIELELYSYNNELSKLDYDLDYTITCSTDDSDKVKCTVNSYAADATNTDTGTIYHSSNTDVAVIYVTPLDNANIQQGDQVTIEVTASTSVPYQKTISCEFTLKVTNTLGTSYSIEDVAGRDYAILKLTNANQGPVKFNLEIVDPTKLKMDANDKAYVDDATVITTNASGYEKKVEFYVESETTRYVKFYKAVKTENYTYPGVQATTPIKVTT